MKSGLTINNVSKSATFGLIVLLITDLFVYLSFAATKLFWQILMFACALVPMMAYGGLLGCCRPIFKSGKMFGAFALFAMIFPIMPIIMVCEYEAPIMQNVLLTIIFIIPIFAGFVCSYELYAIKRNFFLYETELSSWSVILTIITLIPLFFITGIIYWDLIIYLTALYILFIIGIMIGDFFYNAPRLTVLSTLLIPSFLVMTTTFFYAASSVLEDETFPKGSNNTIKEIYFIFAISILSFLPQFLGYKIASRRRRAALSKGNRGDII